MPVIDAATKYIVKSGTKIKLDEIDPSDASLFRGGGKEDHEPFLENLCEQLRQLQKVLYAQNKQRLLVVIQAMDTGGKDGCVKNVFSRVDPQGINVKSFKKPAEKDLEHDFLWRIHPHVPGNGEIVVFNRSHYEDIVAVRVKNLRPDEVWKKRYRHVMEFERMLADEGTTVVKIYLHISKDEQKERLQSRLDEPSKHWKFNPDDLADRARWGKFMEAYEDLLSQTSTKHAPWYIVPANRKWYRNLCVARIMVDTLDKLDMKYPQPDWDAREMKID